MVSQHEDIFHLHGLIAAGALAEDGSRWIAGGAEFLFPLRALSKKFRGKFLAGFKKLLARGELRLPHPYADGHKRIPAMLKRLRKKSWGGCFVCSVIPFAFKLSNKT